MALLIQEQPTGQILARSPVLYLIYDSRAGTEDNPEYIARVFVWSDEYASKPTTYFDTRRFPNVGNSASFNVSEFLKSQFNDIDLPAGELSNQMVQNVQVDFWFKSDTSTPNYATPEVSSTLLQFVNGYSYPSEGINVANLEDVFLTDRPKEARLPYGSYFSLAFQYDAASLIKTVLVESNLGTQYLYDIETDFAPLDNANQNVAHIYTGAEVTAYGFPKLGTEWYSVQGMGSGGVTEITDKYYFYIDEGCKWGYLNLGFINKYGVWDYVQFYGRKDQSYKVDRETFERSGLWPGQSEYNYFTGGQHRQVNTTAMEMLTANTGFITEAMSEVIRQLMLSEMIIDADTLTPYTIESTQETYKQKPNERLINYAISFKKSNSLINTIS